MASKEIELPTAIGQAGRIGQGTVIEQSRAVAEVHAAVYLAHQFPRDETAASRAMENSCRHTFVAEKAFYRMPRAGGAVTGPTIHLAKELARTWGHIHHGIFELRRDDEHHQSEMQAYAWDVQTGTRLVHAFIVPHKRDKTKDGITRPEELETLQSIYENNANNGARRLRECILGVLPPWFTERAKQLCRETLNAGDGKPLEERVDNCIAIFKEIGVSLDQLERKLELQRLRWTGHELGLLATIYGSLQRNEILKDDEFPPAVVKVADLSTAPASQQPAQTEKPAPAPAPQVPPAETEAPDSEAEIGPSSGGPVITEQTGVTSEDLPGPGATAPEPVEPAGAEDLEAKVSRALLAAVTTLLKDNGLDERADQLAVASLMLDDRVPMLGDLRVREARYLLKRIPELVSAGTFQDTIARARAAAKS